MAASSFVKMPFCRYRVGSWIKVLVPPGTPYQHHTESEMLFLISQFPFVFPETKIQKPM